MPTSFQENHISTKGNFTYVHTIPFIIIEKKINQFILPLAYLTKMNKKSCDSEARIFRVRTQIHPDPGVNAY